MKKNYDVIIVGAGSMGMAAGYYLAKQGIKTLLLDANNPPHSYGSHHGETRIIRHAYGEGRKYVPLTKRSQELWNDLQAEVEKELFINTGVISIGKKESIFLNEIKESSRTYDLPIDVLNSNETKEMFPGLSIPSNYEALLEKSSGVLRVEECVSAFKQLAISNHANLVVDSPVISIEYHSDGVTVKTDKDQYYGDKLIVSAGAWTNKLLTELELPLKPLRKTVAWFNGPNNKYDYTNFPCFLFDLGDEKYYGFPSFNGNGIKIGRHDSGEMVDPDYFNRNFVHEDGEELVRVIQTFFPHAIPIATRGQVCMYTMTPDEDFIIDRHPNHENVFIAAGFSGHGFKFASVIGEILSELVISNKTKHDISPFKIFRAYS